MLLVASDRFGWAGVGIHVVVLLVALPYGWVVWKLMRRNWLLLTGLILALAAMMVFWVAGVGRRARTP